MTVKEIITEYLTEHGYDGLFTYDCGCELCDLMPCGDGGADCIPGYKRKPRADLEEDMDVDWVIGPQEASHWAY